MDLLADEDGEFCANNEELVLLSGVVSVMGCLNMRVLFVPTLACLNNNGTTLCLLKGV